MANRIVQAVYDLKDNITGKLKTINDALRGNRAESQKTTDAVERNNKRASDSYKKTADSLAGLRNAIVALGAFVGLAKVKQGIEAVIDTGERLDDLSKEFGAVFGSVAKGGEVLEKVRTIAAGVPQGFEDVAAAAIAMRKAGLDPLDGSLQALLDNQNAVNQSQEELIKTIEALGKANLRGEANFRTFVTLTEQGIPVFQLLAKAMGMSEDQVRSLAETGQLGKDAIKLLIDELGNLRAGVAADELGDVDAQVQKLKDTAVQFLDTIAKSGALDFFRSELRDLNAEVAEAAENGRLQALAKSVSDGIVATGNAVKATIGFVINYSSALILLAKAYALVKVQSFLDGLAAVASGASKATGIVRGLATAIMAIPAIRLAVIGGSAVVLAADYARQLGDAIGEVLPATEKWRERARELNAEIREGAERTRQAAETFEQYRDVQLLSAEAAARLSDAEREAQAERTAGLERYLALQVRYYEQLKAAEGLNADGLAYLEELKQRLATVRDSYGALAEGARLAAEAMDSRMTASAQALAKGLVGITDSAKVAGDRISALIGDFDKLSIVELGDIVLALQSIGEKSDGAGDRVRDGLGASLKKLSGEDLQRFQMAATAAFDEVGRTGKETAVILDTILHTAMDRLKVDASKTGVAFTEAGKDIIATFQVIAENSRATATEIEASFNAALAGVKTKEEAEALGQALQAAMSTGRLGAEATEAAMRRLQDRMRSIKAETDPLADSFSALGIKSKAALDAAASAARTAFEAIVNGAREGTAAQEDVTAAFNAYAEAQRAAVANSNEATKTQLERQLELQAASLGIAEAFKKVGETGKQAGDEAAAAFGNLRDRVQETTDAAEELADGNRDVADSHDAAAESARGYVAAADGILVLSAEQEKAFKLLREELARYGTLQNVSANTARDLLDSIGHLIGTQAQVLQDRIRDLDAAARQAQETADRMADEARSIQDQIDQLQGNEADIEKRRHEKKLADLKAEAEATGQLGTAAYNELVRLENELHKLKLRNLREQGQASGRGPGGALGGGGSQGAPDAAGSAPGDSADGSNGGGGGQSPRTTGPVTFAPNIILLTGDGKAKEELTRALLPYIDRIQRASR